MTLLCKNVVVATTTEPLGPQSLDLPGSQRPLLDARAEIAAYNYATADSDEAREASVAAIADAFRLDGHSDPRAAAEAELRRRGALKAELDAPAA